MNKWILAGGGNDEFIALPLIAINIGGAIIVMLDLGWGMLGIDGKLKKRSITKVKEDGGQFYETQVSEKVILACYMLCILYR